MPSRKMDVPFTQVANVVLDDPRLSMKAKGLFAYCYSKPNGWSFNARRIINNTKDGYESILAGLKELEAAGYLVRSKKPDGSMEYYFKFDKNPDSQSGVEPVTENTSLGNPESGKSRAISNTEEEVILNYKKERTVAKADPENSKEIAEVINVFKGVNPAISFGHKTFRQAAADLIKQFGYDETLNTARAAVAVQSQRYAPVITNPYQLKTKLGELNVFLQKENNKSNITVI